MRAVGRRILTGAPRPETLARLTLPVNIVLVIVLAHGLAKLSWNLIAQPPTVSPPAVGSTRQPAATQVKGPDYDVIAGWHLFGAVNTAAPVLEPTVTAPETPLNLKLVGVFFTRDGGKPLALIAAGTGEELGYTVGAQVPGGARLEQILRDRVVLSRKGRLETLSLPREAGGIETGAEPEPTLSPEEDIELSPDSGATRDASSIAERFRQVAANRPQALQDLAFVTPYVQDGQFMGYRLRPGRDPQLLSQLGLQAGDVITSVNGARLENPAQALNMIREVVGSEEVTVQVLRNGGFISFTFLLSSQ